MIKGQPCTICILFERHSPKLLVLCCICFLHCCKTLITFLPRGKLYLISGQFYKLYIFQQEPQNNPKFFDYTIKRRYVPVCLNATSTLRLLQLQKLQR